MYLFIYFFKCRMLKRNLSLTRKTSVIHPILCAVLVSISIYLWTLLGCPGISECYLCQTFSSNIFSNCSIVDETSADDFTRLIDLKNFTFLINNLVCDNSDLPLLVLVHSHPRHFEHRWTIRNTWGNTIDSQLKLLFLLGIPSTEVIQNQIQKENAVYGDLIQGNFLDTYRNLTYKHVMAFKWTKYFCSRVKYLLKTDDDVFINSPSLIEYVNGYRSHLPDTKLMRCSPVYEARVKRSSRSKWRVSWSEYKFPRYPPYCQGFAILYSSDVVYSLYAKAQVAKYFWIDDVFITGFLASSTNYTPSTFGKLLMEAEDLNKLYDVDSNYGFSFLLGPYNLSMSDIIRLWKKALKAGLTTDAMNS